MGNIGDVSLLRCMIGLKELIRLVGRTSNAGLIIVCIFYGLTSGAGM
jgi:hypothetical protein